MAVAELADDDATSAASGAEVAEDDAVADGAGLGWETAAAAEAAASSEAEAEAEAGSFFALASAFLALSDFTWTHRVSRGCVQAKRREVI